MEAVESFINSELLRMPEVWKTCNGVPLLDSTFTLKPTS